MTDHLNAARDAQQRVRDLAAQLVDAEAARDEALRAAVRLDSYANVCAATGLVLHEVYRVAPWEQDA